MARTAHPPSFDRRWQRAQLTAWLTVVPPQANEEAEDRAIEAAERMADKILARNGLAP